MNRTRGSALLASAIVVCAAVAAFAGPAKVGEWPQFRGPARDGISRETGLLKAWPEGGPKLLWKASGLGEAHSSVAVAGGVIYSMGLKGTDEHVWAVDVSGKPLWSTPIGQAGSINGRQGGQGSRCVPTVDGARLYVEGPTGQVACLEAASGKVVWKKHLVQDFGGRVQQWGYSESPLVDGDKVIVTPGGRAATLVALSKTTGEPIWRAQVPEGDGAGYASAIAVDVGGKRQIIQFLAGGVVGINAADGAFLWRFNSPANRTANAAAPIYSEGTVFASSGYNNGGALARLTDGGAKAEEVYFTKDMQNHHGGMVLLNGYIYGANGSNLACVDLKTGVKKWEDRSVGKGSITYADGNLYYRSERGPVALVEANPSAYTEKGRFDQPERSSAPAWAYPVVAGGRLYIRDQDNLFCYDVKSGG